VQPGVAQANASSSCDAAVGTLQPFSCAPTDITDVIDHASQQRCAPARPLLGTVNPRASFIAMNVWDLLQWPAMVATLASTWLVGSRRKTLRVVGFYTFLVSNALWIAWGWHDGAWALVALQVGLAILNVRGAAKNETGA
jgi:hypothetical protein